MERRTRIVEDGSPRRVELSRESMGQTASWLDRSPVRERISAIFDEHTSFSFIRTTANPEADVLLHQAGMRYRPALLDTVMSALDRCCADIAHVRYPLIGTRGVHSGSRRPDMVFWPCVHVVRFEDADTFRVRAGSLLDAYDIMCGIEAPQDYRRPEIDALHDAGVQPLVVQDRSWTVKGSGLRDALDFLTQDVYCHEWRGPTMDVD